MIRVTSILLVAIAGMVVSVWIGRTWLDRQLTTEEMVFSGIAITLIYRGITMMQRHRARKRLDCIRDSALW